MPVFPPTRPPASAGSTVALLSRRSFLVALAVVLAIFFLLNPMWRPIDMAAMDANILWSYLPIPALAAGLLAWERKLRWASFLLETLRLTLVKFAITFLIANVLWSFVAVPPRVATGPSAASSTDVPPASSGRFEVQEAPPPTPIDPAGTGRVAGRVVDGAGAPRPGLVVAVTGGLEGLRFAPHAEPIVLSHADGSFQPSAAIVQVYDRLVLRGAADLLHTAAALDERGRPLFNVPVLPGSDRELMFDRPLGRVTLSCKVHGGVEHVAALTVIGSPFGAFTDADGRFAFDAVPVGELELTAWSADGARSVASLRLEPGASAEVVVTMR